MRTFELWRDRRSGEVWAVRLVEGVVEGCSGPLRPRDRDPRYLDGLDYSVQHADRFERERAEFEVAEPFTV